MPSTVKSLMDEVELTVNGFVRWGEPVGVKDPGVYIVAISNSENCIISIESPSIDAKAIDQWIENTPAMTLDHSKPTNDKLVQRIEEYWIPDETVLYIGKTEHDLSRRIRQFYSHIMGRRSPHKGGDWLKLLENLSDLYIYYAATDEPEKKRKVADGSIWKEHDTEYQSNSYIRSTCPICK